MTHKYLVTITSAAYGRILVTTWATSPQSALDAVQAVERCPRRIMKVSLA